MDFFKRWRFVIIVLAIAILGLILSPTKFREPVKDYFWVAFRPISSTILTIGRVTPFFKDTLNFRNIIKQNSDFEFVTRLPKTISSTGLVIFQIEYLKKQFSMPISHLLINRHDSRAVIHKDGNGLNLQHANLDLLGYSQLNHSYRHNYSKLKKNLTSKYRGVSLIKAENRWKAQIMHNGERYIKNFKKEEDAAQWYNDKAKQLFGDYAYQNKI